MRILGPIVLAQTLLMPWDRSLSVTSRVGTKPCFLSNFRISRTAAFPRRSKAPRPEAGTCLPIRVQSSLRKKLSYSPIL